MKGGTARALPTLDSSKCQVNARLADIGFFGNLVLEIFLCVPRHDEQAPMRQFFCEGNPAILPFKAKQRSTPRLTDAITGPISGSASACSPTLSCPF